MSVDNIPGLEGVFGMDMLTNTEWSVELSGDPLGFPQVVGNPNFLQLQFDFTDWASGVGTLWLDLSPELDVVVFGVPEPATWQLWLMATAAIVGLVWRSRRRSTMA